MLPFSLVGRHFFRRASDGMHYATSQQPDSKQVALPSNGNGATPADENKYIQDAQQNNTDSNRNDIKYDANSKAAQCLVAGDGESIV